MPEAKPKRRTKAQQRAETLEVDPRRGGISLLAAPALLRDAEGRGAAGGASALRSSHYYFDDKKKAMFDAVFAAAPFASGGQAHGRRSIAMPANCRGKPTSGGRCCAFLGTDLDLYIQGGRRAGATIAARGAQVADGAGSGAPSCSTSISIPVVLKPDRAASSRRCRSARKKDIIWGYHFVTGALVMTLARTGRIDQLSRAPVQVEDFPAVKARMARFLAFGFRASVATGPRPGRRRGG